RIKLATGMMSTDAGFHADQARWHVGKPCLHLVARPLLTQHNCAAIVQADNVERVLTDIDADYGYRSLCCRKHGVLLCLGAPGQLIAGGAGARSDHPISGHAPAQTVSLPSGAYLRIDRVSTLSWLLAHPPMTRQGDWLAQRPD